MLKYEDDNKEDRELIDYYIGARPFDFYLVKDITWPYHCVNSLNSINNTIYQFYKYGIATISTIEQPLHSAVYTVYIHIKDFLKTIGEERRQPIKQINQISCQLYSMISLDLYYSGLISKEDSKDLGLRVCNIKKTLLNAKITPEFLEMVEAFHKRIYRHSCKDANEINETISDIEEKIKSLELLEQA